ncbi:MAG TPA: 3-phosphoshikimate 1-carboxyvinyltransferase, partial [Planctomycetaceae bacterium]|nr:3-phosphoshikimate 1-carboxyvinyltransferase [Planctomycetaceae bacterium]
MGNSLEIVPVTAPIRGTIRPPGSKSLTNRALILAAIADGTSELTGVLDSRDTQVMMDSLGRLGIKLENDLAHQRVRVEGCNGRIPARRADLYLENSGTSIRFLAAICTLGQGQYRLGGNERMRQRPIGDLLEALNQLGAHSSCEQSPNCPPVVIESAGLRGGTTHVQTNLSSQ